MYGGSCWEVAGELIQGCSGVDPRLLGGAARELLGGVTRKVSQGCSGSRARVARESCSGIEPGMLGS